MYSHIKTPLPFRVKSRSGGAFSFIQRMLSVEVVAAVLLVAVLLLLILLLLTILVLLVVPVLVLLIVLILVLVVLVGHHGLRFSAHGSTT